MCKNLLMARFYLIAADNSTVSSRIEWLYVVRNMDLAISQITNV